MSEQPLERAQDAIDEAHEAAQKIPDASLPEDVRSEDAPSEPGDADVPDEPPVSED